MREELIRQIASRWSELSIPFQIGGSSDLTVHTEFMDASWSSGKKKITYEASIFADESARTIFMYEKTTESGQGFSFGSNSESSFQSGKTLFRKIKMVQYGPDGKAFEIELDLGAISHAAKETAKAAGWSFKTVLKREKASYPPGFKASPENDLRQPATSPVAPQPASPTPQQTARFCTKCGAPLSEGPRFCGTCGAAVSAPATPEGTIQPSAPSVYAASPLLAQPAPAAPVSPVASASSTAQRRGGSKFAMIAFISLAVLTALIYLLMSVSIIGWAAGVVILGAAFMLQRKRSTKGFLKSLIIWVLTAALLMLVLVLTAQESTSQKTTGVSSSASTPAVGQTTAKASTISGSAGSTVAGASSAATTAKPAGDVLDMTVVYLVTDFTKNTTSLMEVNSKTLKPNSLMVGSGMNQISVTDKVYALVSNRLATISQGQVSYLVPPESYVVRYVVKGGSIFYGKDNTNASDTYFERLAMITTSGQNDHDLHEMGVGQLLVDDAVYFKPNSGSEVQSLLRLNLDGTGKTAIYKGSVAYLVKSKSYLYFIDYNQNSALYRIKPDGSDAKKMADGPFKFEMVIPSQFNGLYTLAPIDDTLYYINPKDSNKLYRLDDSGNTKVSDTSISRVKASPVGNGLVVTYALSSNKPGLYILSTTGQELVKLTGENVTEFVIR